MAEVSSESAGAREEVETLRRENAQAEAELRLLRRAREEASAEIASLRQAVGTAMFERDAASQQQQAKQAAASRAEETIERQCEVIKELDAERLSLRTNLEVSAAELGRMTSERDQMKIRLLHTKEAHAQLQV